MSMETIRAVALIAEVRGALETLGVRAPAARHPEAVVYLCAMTLEVQSMHDAAKVLRSVDELDALALVDLHGDLRGRVLSVLQETP
jgi:hypothetical protein